MSPPNVLIAGSGIAGAVFAWWLLKAFPEANITIVERSPALRLTGASVDIRNSAVDIIKLMGCEQAIRAAGTKEEGLAWIDSKGRSVATLMATGDEKVQSFTSEYEIFRGELAKIFITPVLERVDLVLDEYVEKFENLDDGVTVTFAKSKEVKKYDYLVAADGFRSKIRGQLLGTNPREQIHDEGVHVCYFTIKKDLLDGSKLARWYNAPGGRCILLRPDPSGKTRGHFMNVTTKKDVAMRKRLNDAVEQGNEAYMDLVEEQFKDAGWIAKDVLKGMRDSDDFYCSLFAQIRSPKLQSGRVVLLGDAGYATPGIGTSLAIIGAHMLAGELLLHQGDITQAFQNYEEAMARFAKTQQGDGNAMQIMNPQSEWGIWLRNMIFGVVTGLGIDRIAMKSAAALGIGHGKNFELNEYPWPEEVEIKV